ncbi:g1299 [Coccomyxa viridis]|uniref:G1299 protein n=1 Tax=Coccomyxa viridis TaxID=1274662 RepID=A0ABP1FJU1_9CHLO
MQATNTLVIPGWSPFGRTAARSATQWVLLSFLVVQPLEKANIGQELLINSEHDETTSTAFWQTMMRRQ